MSAIEPTRVVLVKPGDVLILGNVGAAIAAENISALGELAQTLKDVLDLSQVVICADDVSIAAETPGAPRRPTLAEYTDEDAIRTAWAERGFAPGEIDELVEVWRAQKTKDGTTDASADYQ